MKLKPIESIPVMKVPKRPPARKKTPTTPVPVEEEEEALPAPPTPEPEPTLPKIQEKILLLKRFCEKIQSNPEHYQKSHPALWQLYQEVQELVKE